MDEMAQPWCPPGTAHVEISVSPAEIGSPGCFPVSSDTEIGSRVDPALGEISARLIDWANEHIASADRGHSTVVCWGWKDWGRLNELYTAIDFPLAWIMGFVSGLRGTISLARETCERLGRIGDPNSPHPNSVVAKMIGVLAHESLHTAGVRDEGAAECYSLQITTRVATWLSGDIDYAQQSAELNSGYFRDFWDGTMYDDPECRQHSELDLGITGASWSA